MVYNMNMVTTQCNFRTSSIAHLGEHAWGSNVFYVLTERSIYKTVIGKLKKKALTKPYFWSHIHMIQCNYFNYRRKKVNVSTEEKYKPDYPSAHTEDKERKGKIRS